MRSGKSSLAAELGVKLGFPVVSFGDYVRAQARERGIEETRANLQSLGAHLIQEFGWRQFVQSVLDLAPAASGSSRIVEGVRHINAVTTLRELVGANAVVCIGLRTPDERRMERASEVELRSFEQYNLDSTEIEIPEVLYSSCDLVLNGEKPIELLAEEAVKWLRSEGRLGSG